MKFVTIYAGDDMAVVELRPSRLERLLGAEVEHVWLDWDERGQLWRAANTRKPLYHLKHGAAIAHALDFQPASQLPIATATGGAA